MLSEAECRERVSRLLARVDAEIELLIITRPEHVYYLANYLPSPNNIDHRAPAYLVVQRGGSTTLVLDGFVRPQSDVAVDDVIHGRWNVADPGITRARGTAKTAAELIQRAAPQVVGVEAAATAAMVTGDVPVVRDVEPDIGRMRQVKDRDEINLIRAAVRVGEALHAASWDLVRPGMREIDVYSGMLAKGLEVAEGPFVMMCEFISGPRAFYGGGQPTMRRMESGDNIIMDLFPYVDGYRCDLTNTITVGGQPTAVQRASFDAVHEALMAAEAMIRPGVSANDIYVVQDEVLRRADPGWGLRAHAGHALGLEHPEAPDFMPGIDGEIIEGMVIALEPAAYGQPFHGVRLEHNYLVTAGGLETISSHRLGLS